MRVILGFKVDLRQFQGCVEPELNHLFFLKILQNDLKGFLSDGQLGQIHEALDDLSDTIGSVVSADTLHVLQDEMDFFDEISVLVEFHGKNDDVLQ